MSLSLIVFESEAVSPGLNFIIDNPRISQISQRGFQPQPRERFTKIHEITLTPFRVHSCDLVDRSLCQIKTLYQIAMMRGDNLAFELSGRCHLLFFNFKIVLENCEFLD